MTANVLRRRSVALAAGIAIAFSGPVAAQTRLYLLVSSSSTPWDYGDPDYPARILQLDVDDGRITANTIGDVREGVGIDLQVTPDGRYLLWNGGEFMWPVRVSLFDIARQQQSTLVSATLQPLFVPFSVHPSAMRAFLQLSPFGPVTVAEPGSTRTLPVPPCANPVFATRSGDGRRLSYHCDQQRSVMVVDSVDGQLLGAVPLGPSAFILGATQHVLNAAGSTVYAVDSDQRWDGDDLVLYRRFDVATGALLAERRGSTSSVDMWQYNEATGHLFAGMGTGILVIDATTLAEIGWIGRPLPWMSAKMALDPDQPYAYVVWRRESGYPVRVSLVHTGTLATLGSIEIPLDGALLGIALGPRPPRVSELTILVNDRLATLTWATDTSRSIATSQVVEVGFAPGETALRLGVAAGATSLTVPGVPPGRYYVRIRSVNGTGVGGPSNEVLVDVP